VGDSPDGPFRPFHIRGGGGGGGGGAGIISNWIRKYYVGKKLQDTTRTQFSTKVNLEKAKELRARKKTHKRVVLVRRNPWKGRKAPIWREREDPPYPGSFTVLDTGEEG